MTEKRHHQDDIYIARIANGPFIQAAMDLPKVNPRQAVKVMTTATKWAVHNVDVDTLSGPSVPARDDVTEARIKLKDGEKIPDDVQERLIASITAGLTTRGVVNNIDYLHRVFGFPEGPGRMQFNDPTKVSRLQTLPLTNRAAVDGLIGRKATHPDATLRDLIDESFDAPLPKHEQVLLDGRGDEVMPQIGTAIAMGRKCLYSVTRNNEFIEAGEVLFGPGSMGTEVVAQQLRDFLEKLGLDSPEKIAAFPQPELYIAFRLFGAQATTIFRALMDPTNFVKMRGIPNKPKLLAELLYKN